MKHIYRFDCRGQRFYVSADNLPDAYKRIREFNPRSSLQHPEEYRPPHSKANLRKLNRTPRKSGVWDDLKSDGPDYDGDFAVSPLPKIEMYRNKYRSICPSYFREPPKSGNAVEQMISEYLKNHPEKPQPLSDDELPF